MTSLFIHASIMIIGVLIASAAQVLLKSEAVRPHENIIREYLNLRVILGYGMLLASTLFAIYAYRVLSVSFGSVLDSTGYIFVTLLSYFVFKERIDCKRIIAICFIVVGIAVYSVLG